MTMTTLPTTHQIPADGALLLENVMGVLRRRQERLLLVHLLQIAAERRICGSDALKEAALPQDIGEQGQDQYAPNNGQDDNEPGQGWVALLVPQLRIGSGFNLKG